MDTFCPLAFATQPTSEVEEHHPLDYTIVYPPIP